MTGHELSEGGSTAPPVGLPRNPRRSSAATQPRSEARGHPLWWLWIAYALSVTCLGLGAGCATQGLRPAVTMHVTRSEDTPKGALVYIDEQYIGTLGYVAARGVRLPEGEHRISVEKTGYFPYDVIVVSDREPIHLEVRLVRLPE